MVNRIAVLRANALGDFIFTLPALQSLRVAFPEAEIVLLGKELHQRLLADRPAPVNRVIVIPPYPGVGHPVDGDYSPTLLDEFFADMVEEKFDVAFQMHGGGRYSNSFVRRLNAKLMIGSKTPNAEPLDINVPYTTYFNETLRYLELVSFLGVKPHSLEPHISVTANDVLEANSVLENIEHRPIVVVQAGATDLRRRWPCENFAVVADALIARGYHICFNGVQNEYSIVENIKSKMQNRGHIQNLCGILSLSGLIGLLSKASLMISNDTGPLHVAHALKTPSVGLYWAPNMVTSSPVSCAFSKPLISWNTNCPVCGERFPHNEKNPTCTHDVSFVWDITTEQVLTAVDEMLHAQANVVRNILQ